MGNAASCQCIINSQLLRGFRALWLLLFTRCFGLLLLLSKSLEHNDIVPRSGEH